MKNIKTFSQLFENEVQLKPSHYWVFVTYVQNATLGTYSKARFLVSEDSTRSITNKFLEDLLPKYLGFDSLYALSSEITPPEIDGDSEFNNWVYSNVDDIAAGAGIKTIYIHGKEIVNGKDFPEFINAFNEEDEGVSGEEYTEISGNVNSIAWLILNYIKQANAFAENVDKMILDVLDIFNTKVGDTLKNKNGDLTVGEKYTGILNSIFDSNESLLIYDYFKNHPLEIYIIDNPKLKEKILNKIGIRDFGDIGMNLKNGLF